MLFYLRRGIVCFAGVLLFLIAGLWFWSTIEVPSGKGSPDPAVVMANTISAKLINNQSEQYKESYFSFRQLDLHYVEIGSQHKDTIVFVHGFPQFWYSFNRQIEDLSDDYHIIAIDGLGAGRSSAPLDSSHYKLSAMAEHLSELLESLNIESAHLVGHDWGASLVYGFAQLYPQQSKTAVGISGPPLSVMLDQLQVNKAQQSASSYVEKLKGSHTVLLKLLSATDRVWSGLYQPLIEQGLIGQDKARIFAEASNDVKRLNAHINWYRANIPDLDDIRLSDYWPTKEVAIAQPSMLIWGNEDRVFDASVMRSVQRDIPQLQLIELEGVGHSPQLEAPEKTTELLREFFLSND